MRGNSFGHLLSISTFGESHGLALGAVVDGCPSCLNLCVDDFHKELDRRRPAQSPVTSGRGETDRVEILSGIFEGQTLGTPIALMVRNVDARSEDYSPDEYRQGHADLVWEQKFGIRDWRGGGRSSGRETVARVLGGVVAQKILGSDVKIVSFTRAVGECVCAELPSSLSREEVDSNVLRCPDSRIAQSIEKKLTEFKKQGNSLGGVVETWIDGIPEGWGEPVFRKLKSQLASAMLGIGGAVGFELGKGFSSSQDEGVAFHASSKNLGGIVGGLSTGERIVFRVAFKPTSTLGKKAQEGRHDPCIVPRVVPVVDAMAALVLAEAKLEKKLNRL